jgi:hypothetical protein
LIQNKSCVLVSSDQTYTKDKFLDELSAALKEGRKKEEL